jgi:type II secretory pathway component PulK
MPLKVSGSEGSFMIHAPDINRETGGSVLILVLWALVFLGLMTVGAGTMARQRIILSDNIEKRSELYSIVSSGAMVVIDALVSSEGKDIFHEEDLMNILASKEGAFYPPVRLGKGSFEWGDIGLVDESGKINVNYADMNTLRSILGIAGRLDSAAAEKLAGNVIDWRDKDDVVYGGGSVAGEREVYSRKGYGYAPRNLPFVCLEELLLVDGMSPEIFFRIRGHITVFGSGRVNVNTASSEVLEALGMSRDAAEKILSFREHKASGGSGSGRNIFRALDDLNKVFNEEKDDPGRENERREIDNLLFSGKAGVNAEVFSLLCVGKLERGGPEGKLFCAFDRTGRMLYWGYVMTGRGQ